MDIADGWLQEVTRAPSPNKDNRPEGGDISLLVIHNISLPPGEFGGGYIEKLFANQLDGGAHPYFAAIADLKVSAHLLIDRAGQVTQFVNFADRAWHAGQSRYADRERCNDYAVGIELEGTDIDAFTDQQYGALAAVSRALMAAYPAITPDRIVGHRDIAPGRKTDPGDCFDWYRYLTSLSNGEDN